MYALYSGYQKGKLEIFQGYLLSRSVSRLLCLAKAQGEISTKKKLRKPKRKYIPQTSPEVAGIYKRKQESKKEGKHAFDHEKLALDQISKIQPDFLDAFNLAQSTKNGKG